MKTRLKTRLPQIVSFLSICSCLFTMGLLVSAGCGKGGPGDNKAPDAAVWFDASHDGDSSVEADADDIDAEVSQDAEVTEVQTVDATTLRHEQVPFVMGQTYIDLRDPADYGESHIPKAKNLPAELLWDGAALVEGGSALQTLAPVTDLPVYFYDVAANQATTEAIAEAVLDAGYTDVFVLEGGLEAWRSFGFYEDIKTAGVYNLHYNPIPQNHYIVDTMPEADYTTGHITGALNVDTEKFYVDGDLINGGQVLLDAIPCTAEVVIFYCINEGCSASEKASEAAEILSCYDNTTILHYPAGLVAWEGMTYPVSCGTEPDGACP